MANGKRPFEDLETAAFENYDNAANFYDADASFFDEDGFDQPDGYGGNKPAPRRKRIKSNFDLTFVNGAAIPLKVELFNSLSSFLKFQRTDFINAPYTYLPVTTSPNNLIAAGAGTVGFRTDGALYVRGAANDGTQLIVSCTQFPMQGLNEASAKGMKLTSIRMKTSSDSQIDNDIIHTKRTFMGSQSTNRISPRTFFRPEQFQALIVDIPLGIFINAERGIEYTVNAGETVKWNVSLER